VTHFIANLALRLKQLENIAVSGGNAPEIWLGGLFQPEAFITAARQMTAHANCWSLELLTLSLDIENTGGEGSFVINGELASAQGVTL
jgi:dynein heavy chain 1